MAPTSPQVRARTPATLRREILGAMHALTGTMEPWREVGLVMRRYLGPRVGMSATGRWETLGAVELELLADAVLERAAIVTAQADAGKPREVVVCGGRDHQPTSEDGRWVTYWLAWLSARVVVHGGARGVDRWAGTLAARLGLEAVCVPADWDAHGKAAGPIRNVAMAERFPVAVLALPGGRGTADMCKTAGDLRIPVITRNDPTAKARAS
jgi:hypothetical protein